MSRRLAAKLYQGDKLYEAVISCVTTDPQTSYEIYNHFIKNENLTVAKISARLRAAVRYEIINKDVWNGKVYYYKTL